MRRHPSGVEGPEGRWCALSMPSGGAPPSRGRSTPNLTRPRRGPCHSPRTSRPPPPTSAAPTPLDPPAAPADADPEPNDASLAVQVGAHRGLVTVPLSDEVAAVVAVDAALGRIGPRCGARPRPSGHRNAADLRACLR